MTKRTCSVPGCERIHYGRGWCSLHYARWRVHGSTDMPSRKRPAAPLCSIEGCEQPSADRGLCATHWHQNKAQRSATRRGRKSRSTLGNRPKAAASRVSSAKSCASEGCNKKPVAKGLCSWHYQVARDARQPVCSVDGCNSPERAKNLCPNHYAYLRRHGVLAPQFTCEGCREVFPGRASTRHCVSCKPTPNFYAQERKVRLAANNASMTEGDFEESVAYRDIIASDPCVYCAAASTAVDHVTPIVEGGSDRWENLAPVCKPCNSRKRSRSVLAVMLSNMATP